MPKYVNLLGGDPVEVGADKKKNCARHCHRKSVARADKVKATRPKGGLGCEHCPLNEAESIRKVRGLKRIKGRKMMLWAQAPGGVENRDGLELVGPAGRWLWDEFEKVGLYRSDFDIQNVVRCWPTVEDEETGRRKDRAPSKQEAKCCSIYNQEALQINGGKAVVHVILGQFAARQLLGKEFKKDRPLFWSDKLNARIVCLDHPSYFLRGAPRSRLMVFRRRLHNIKKALDRPGKYAYIEEMDYSYLYKPIKVKRWLEKAEQWAATGNRVTVDVETGWVDDQGNPCMDPGKRHEVVLCIGVGTVPGRVRVIVVDHPQNPASHKRRRIVKKLLAKFLENRKVEKIMHHGSSDTDMVQNLLGCKLRGYTWDTNYSTYLKWPNLKAYGLDKLSNTVMHDFSDYKDMILPYLDHENTNFATIPLRVLYLYNAADCDMSKRLENRTKDISHPLLQSYIYSAFTLADMEQRGPWFDYKYFEDVVEPAIPRRKEKVVEELRQLARDPELRLTQRQKVAHIIYGHDKKKYPKVHSLKLPPVIFVGEHSKGASGKDQGKPVYTTNKAAMKLLATQTDSKFPSLYMEWGRLDKMDNTYLKGYKNSADLSGGQIRTIWWLTGTRTGRLRSGGGGEKRPGIVNAQNLHGDPILQNILISDPKWRKVLRSEATRNPSLWKRILALILFLNYDFSQIEIRMLAEMSEDKLLIEHFLSGDDLHSLVGHNLTGLPVSVIKKDKKIRTMIKQLHFGIVYGMGKETLYQSLLASGIKINRRRAYELHDKYFQTYKGVREYTYEMRAFAEQHGYVETLFGFRRPLVHGDDEEDSGGSFWGNQAINSPIQGTAHQLLLFAMAILHLKRKSFGYLHVPVAEVHDALSFYVKVEELPEAVEQGRTLLQEAVPEYIEKYFGRKLKVPLIAEASAGFRQGVMLTLDPGATYPVPKDVEKSRDVAYPLERLEDRKLKGFINTWVKKNEMVDAEIEEKWGIAA